MAATPTSPALLPPEGARGSINVDNAYSTNDLIITKNVPPSRQSVFGSASSRLPPKESAWLKHRHKDAKVGFSVPPDANVPAHAKRRPASYEDSKTLHHYPWVRVAPRGRFPDMPFEYDRVV